MDKKIIKRLLIISSLALAVAALIFIGISIFHGRGNNIYLIIGLICSTLSNIFNIIRNQIENDETKKE